MKLYRLLLLPFAFAIVGAARFLAPWKLIRFGESLNFRLGHLIGNNECYLCECDAGIQPKALDFWIPIGGTKVANKVIYRKYKKHLHTLPMTLGRLVLIVNHMFQGWEKHIVSPANWDRDIHNLWGKPHIGFTTREEKKGLKLLRSLGLPPGAKWVCLFVRDSAYMAKTFPGGDFSYHDYRDSDISDCAHAAFELTKRGYYVIRMGAVILKPFHIKHSKIIDLPMTRENTDFATLYLGAKCAFALGSHAGFMSIPQVFNRPIGIINYVPVEYTPTFANGLFIWKYHMKDGKEMPFQEIINTGAGLCLHGKIFEASGIKLDDNTSFEIYQLAMEMADIAEGNYTPDEQKKFWAMFPRNNVPNTSQPLHGKITIRVGREFLKSKSLLSPVPEPITAS